MNSRIAGATLVLTALIFLTVGRGETAWPGNISLEVNYNAVLDADVRVCDLSSNLQDGIDAWAVQQWNEAVGVGVSIASVNCATNPGFRGVTIENVPHGGCGLSGGDPAPACADNPSSGHDRQALKMSITPDVLDNPQTPGVDPYTLNQLRTVGVHELGHNLGFGHVQCESVMSDCDEPNDPYRFQEPIAGDIANYHAAYEVDPVTLNPPTSPAAGQVQLTWNAAAIWNEESFPIYRQGTGWIASAPRNTSSILLTNQPPGNQTYSMGGFTRADCFGFGGFCAAGATQTVNVQGSIDYEPTGYTPNPACGSCNEGGSKSFTISVRNNGNLTAPVSTVVLKFNGATAPNGFGGVCNVPEIPPGQTRSCTNISPVNLTFRGGPITMHADFNNVVTNESSESNNNSAQTS